MGWEKHFEIKCVELKSNSPLFFSCRLGLPEKFAFTELLMTEFNDYKLSPNEKRVLDHNLRCILKGYEKMEETEWKKSAQKMLMAINKYEGKNLKLKTDGAGVMCVLYLLKHFSHQMNRPVHFVLTDAPLRLLLDKISLGKDTRQATIEWQEIHTSPWHRLPTLTKTAPLPSFLKKSA